MTHFEIYLLTRLDSVDCAFAIIFGITLIPLFLSVFAFINGKAAGCEERVGIAKKGIVRCVLVIGCCMFLDILIPSTKEAAFIYAVPKMMNSEIAKELPSEMKEIKDLALEYVREQLAEKAKK